MRFKIKIPATTANIGAGFDSVGIALNLYLILDVTPSVTWKFVANSAELNGVPSDKSNLIYLIAEQVARKYGHAGLPACRVEMTSEIPLARGLGSSSTAVVAGIELADQLLNLQLSKQVKAVIATEIEGHPDNVAPAIFGGCVIGHAGDSFEYVQVPITSDLTFVTMIPDYELKTADARAVLPEAYSRIETIKGSSIANVSVAALFKRDWALLGKMMEMDVFHQPFRRALVPEYEQTKKFISEFVYGTYLSGAGPTMISLAADEVKMKIPEWEKAVPHIKWQLLKADNTGTQVIRE